MASDTQKKPDYSTWLTTTRLAIQEKASIDSRLHEWPALVLVRDLYECGRAGMQTVYEFGCGTGILASLLPKNLRYIGIDNHAESISIARARCQRNDFRFDQFDIHDGVPDYMMRRASWVIAWAFFKHFSLDGWVNLVSNLIRTGDRAVFNCCVSEQAHDDGTEFHHVHVTREMVNEAVSKAGHTVVLERTRGEPFKTSQGYTSVQPLFLTRRNARQDRID